MKSLQRLIDKIDAYQQRHRFFGFTHAVIKKYGEDGTGYWAALLTYYAFLSLFPLLMVVTTVANNAAGSNPDLEETLISGVTNYFPVLGDQLSSHIHALQRSGFALVAGILFTIYGARGVADVFRHGIRKVWGIDEKIEDGFPLGLIKSLGIIIIGGLGFLLASIIAGMAAAAGHGWAFLILSGAINFFILFWMFNLLIQISLPRHVKLKETWVGAAWAALGLVILQYLGGYILTRELKHLDALYSYFAVTLGLIFWIYLQSQIIYYANQIAVVSSKRKWPRSFDDKKL